MAEHASQDDIRCLLMSVTYHFKTCLPSKTVFNSAQACRLLHLSSPVACSKSSVTSPEAKGLVLVYTPLCPRLLRLGTSLVACMHAQAARLVLEVSVHSPRAWSMLGTLT